MISTGYHVPEGSASGTYITRTRVKKVYRTSNKKHFRKNVKECRDVIVEKVYKQGRDGSVTIHIFDLIAPYIVVTYLEG